MTASLSKALKRCRDGAYKIDNPCTSWRRLGARFSERCRLDYLPGSEALASGIWVGASCAEAGATHAEAVSLVAGRMATDAAVIPFIVDAW
ncbi:MAG: hypothetical protein HOP30_09930 [Cyclobacteriaceae bacterium]|nr:hypothetical protein [Cyclobacteriaceae bacterium]